jgi:hypothetical protein
MAEEEGDQFQPYHQSPLRLKTVCAHPQNENILQAMIAEMLSEAPRLNVHALKRACKSVAMCPHPLTTRTQMTALYGIGPAISNFMCEVLHSQDQIERDTSNLITSPTSTPPQQTDDASENQISPQSYTGKRSKVHEDANALCPISSTDSSHGVQTFTATQLSNWLRDYKDGRFQCLIPLFSGMDGKFLYSQRLSELCDDFGLGLPVARQLFGALHHQDNNCTTPIKKAKGNGSPFSLKAESNGKI